MVSSAGDVAGILKMLTRPHRFFGSGVILATAIVHLLDPAIAQIGNVNTYAHGGCLSNAWGGYPYAVSRLIHTCNRERGTAL